MSRAITIVRFRFNLLLAILFGFIAGLILNVMPCVLPVLGIKILSFAQSNTGSRKDAIVRSVFFSLGILSIFMLLASLAAFANFSWGEQFQNPWVLVGIINSETAHWVDFSPEILKNAHANGQHAMIDFTAIWCMNCQYNKVTVLHTKRIMDLVGKKKIITIKVDLTTPDSLAESLMSHLGSRSVPFLAIFPGNDPFPADRDA